MMAENNELYTSSDETAKYKPNFNDSKENSEKLEVIENTTNNNNISYFRIEKEIGAENYLNDQLEKLYIEQQKRKLSQEKRRKWIQKWGTCCCCFLA